MKKQMRPCFWLLQIIAISIMPLDSWAKQKRRYVRVDQLDNSNTQSRSNQDPNPVPAGLIYPPSEKSSVHANLHPVEPPGPPVDRGISMEYLKKYIDGFESDIVEEARGAETKIQKHAIIYGQVYKECLQYIKPVPHPRPEKLQGDCADTIGFELIDLKGEFTKCMDWHRDQKHTCEKLTDCVSLSDYDEFAFPLQDYGKHVTLKYMYTNLGKDIRSKDRFQCKEFPEGSKTHESHSLNETIRQQKEKENEEKEAAKAAEIAAAADAQSAAEKAEKKRLHLEKIEQLKSQICVDCSTPQDLEAAMNANRELFNMQEIGAKLGIPKMDSRIFDDNKRKFQESDLKILTAEIINTPLETLNEQQIKDLPNRLLKWAADHPKDKELVVNNSLKPLAYHLAKSTHANPHTIDAAIASIEHAIKLTSDGPNKIEFERNVDELKILKVASMAQYGLQRNPYPFVREYNKLLRELEQEVWNTCNKMRANQEDCSDTLNQYNLLKTLPQVAQSVDTQTMASQAGLQQSMHPEQFGMQAGMTASMMGIQQPIDPNHPMAAMAAMSPVTPINPMMGGFPNPGMQGITGFNPANPMAGYNPMNPMSPIGGYNPINPLTGGYNTMAGYNPMNPMNPMMMGGMNPMMGGMNHMMNPMMGMTGMTGMNPMMGMNGMNPMMPGMNTMMPGMNTMMPGMNTMMPGMNTMMPGMNTMMPGMNTMMPGMNTMMPGMSPMMPGMNPMMGMNGMNPMMGGMNGMNPMMGGMNGINPMMGGMNGMNPMMGGMNGMNPMMGGYNQMNPMGMPH